MADKQVSISKYPTGNKPHMMVDYELINLAKGDTISFSNELSQPVADAIIRFYASVEDKNDENPISGFCVGLGDELKVDRMQGSTPGQGECVISANVTESAYLYTVASSPGNAYQTLDPVVIIDRPGFSLLFAIAVPAAAFVLGALGMRAYLLRGRRSGKPGQEAM